MRTLGSFGVPLGGKQVLCGAARFAATVRDAELVLGNFYPVLGKKVSIVSFCPSAEMGKEPVSMRYVGFGTEFA